ncbi:MAG: DUF4376 domain-containing protein [Plesiomonas shigelloides]
MDILNISAARYLESGAIECEVRFEGMDDDITYTATADDTAQTGQAVWQALHSGQWGDITPFAVTAEMIAAAKEGKQREIEAWRVKQEAMPFTFESAGHTWDGGQASMSRLYPVLMAAGSESRDVMAWGNAENNPITMSMTQLGELCAEMARAQLSYNERIYQQTRLMKDRLAALTTLVDIRAFSVSEYDDFT